ncbi:MAG: sulfatase-like hydrolase/transferase [Planctomycetota bacterium]|jgi:arylsulfatase A-like enzyme
MSKRPHIVIFNPDQWRGEALAHMGNPCVPTPNLDSIPHTDGVSFRRAFAQNPVCTPSRCSFMTGWYPHVRGHRIMHHMLREGEPVLLKMLKDAGYFVWWGGKNDLVPGQESPEPYCSVRYRPEVPTRPYWESDREAEWRGPMDGDLFYSFYVGRLDKGDEEVYRDRDWAVVEGAIDVIKNPPTDGPLCLFLALTYPHPPYAVEEPWYSMIDRSKVPPRIPTPDSWEGKPSILRGIHEHQQMQAWSEERWTELRATYYGMCARLDHQFGMLMDALKKAGIYDETAVFMFSDHGDFTGDYGLVEKTQNTFEDVLCRVPLVVKPPASLGARPRVSNALVELTDFSATRGIEPGYPSFGRSLVRLLRGEADEHRDAAFSEGGRLHGETHCMELESKSFQNPEGLYYPRLLLQRSEGPAHTKAAMCRTADYKYVRRLYESDELYDLRSDPGELNNRIDDPACAAVLQELKERLLTFYMETCDVVPHQTDSR